MRTIGVADVSVALKVPMNRGPGAASSAERLRVLIVEDSRMFTSALKFRFEADLGVDVVTCGSLAEMRLAAAAADHGFYVAVTDLNLPDSPQGEALDYALSIELPTIVFTGKFDFHTRASILKKNVLDYVIKDNDRAFDEIVTAVSRIISNREFRILVVDDSKTQRSILSAMLQAQKFQIVEASSGEEALEAVKSDPGIRMVLTDYHMGDMDGYQLTRKLRRSYSDDALRIIGISNSDDPALSASFLKAGASDFLYRPFVQEEFQCRIAQNIGILVKMEALKKAVAALSPAVLSA